MYKSHCSTTKRVWVTSEVVKEAKIDACSVPWCNVGVMHEWWLWNIYSTLPRSFKYTYLQMQGRCCMETCHTGLLDTPYRKWLLKGSPHYYVTLVRSSTQMRNWTTGWSTTAAYNIVEPIIKQPPSTFKSHCTTKCSWVNKDWCFISTCGSTKFSSTPAYILCVEFFAYVSVYACILLDNMYVD